MQNQSRHTGGGGPAGVDLEARIERLAAEAQALSEGREQRRDPLIENAEREGLPRSAAEQAYDVAVEVGLEPALGLALVLEGISIRPLGGAAAEVGASESVEPEWVDTPPTPEQAARERRLRQTFRRMRSLLERETAPEAAVRALAREPDVEAHEY